MLARLCSKSFKLGFSSMWTENFQMYKLVLAKAEKPQIKLPTFVESWRKQRNPWKVSTFASWTMLKPLTVWITTNCGKFFKRWEWLTTLPVFWETYVWVKKQQLELDMEQWTCSELGKEYEKAVYYHPPYLIFMQSTSCEIMGWMNHKLESRLPGEIPTNSDRQMIPLKWRKVTAAMKFKILDPQKESCDELSVLKSRDIILQTKVHIVKTMVFPIVMYWCESWITKKAECQRIDSLKFVVLEKTLESPWTPRRSNQSILKEITPNIH